MAQAGNTGIRRIARATVCSVAGLRAAWSYEAAFRQECVLICVLCPVAFVIARTAVEWCLLIGSSLLVLIVELLNSAVEAAVDRVGREHHRLSGRAKDLGSAAVMLSLALMAVIWASVAWTYLSGRSIS